MVQIKANQEAQKSTLKLSGGPEPSVKTEPVFPTANINYTGRPFPESMEKQYLLKISGGISEKSSDEISIVAQEPQNIGEGRGNAIKGLQ